MVVSNRPSLFLSNQKPECSDSVCVTKLANNVMMSFPFLMMSINTFVTQVGFAASTKGYDIAASTYIKLH